MADGAKVRFGLVGAGQIGRAYALAVSACESTELVAVADSRPAAARDAAALAGCKAVTDYRALAAPEQLDAVLICTPPASHAEISTYFLDRGVNVLCEKPLSIRVDDALAMLEAARRNRVILTMASKFRYVDDVIRARGMVASGIIGDVVLFENAFTSRVDMAAKWNSDPTVSGGGVLIDNGTHSVDIMRYFLGALADVQVVEGKRTQGLTVEDTVRIFVRSTSGVMGSIDLSWSINKEQDQYISLYGSEGTVHVGWRESKYKRLADGDWVVFGTGYDKIRALAGQLDNFARAIRGEEPLRITAEDALASVEVVAAAYAALRRSSWTSVGLDLVAPALSQDAAFAQAGSSA